MFLQSGIVDQLLFSLNPTKRKNNNLHFENGKKAYQLPSYPRDVAAELEVTNSLGNKHLIEPPIEKPHLPGDSIKHHHGQNELTR